MSSRPLFISVAESIVILPPIAQVGCLRASSTVTSARSARRRPRNGPPLAVRTRRSTVPAPSPSRSWCSAECSESTGMIRAPVASASCVTSSPPTTSDSLLASARSMPSPSVATVGPRPAEPTSALRTRSAPDSMTSRTSPSAPFRTSPSVQASAARAPASASASAIRSTPCSRACATSVSHERSALRPTSSRSRERETMSSACVPIEPVDPRMRRRRATGSVLQPRIKPGFGSWRAAAVAAARPKRACAPHLASTTGRARSGGTGSRTSASHHTLVHYDERGCGLFDRERRRRVHARPRGWPTSRRSSTPPGVDRFALLGISQGAAIAIVYCRSATPIASATSSSTAATRAGRTLPRPRCSACRPRRSSSALRVGWADAELRLPPIVHVRCSSQTATPQQMTWFDEHAADSRPRPRSAARICMRR